NESLHRHEAVAGRAPHPEPPPRRYADYIAWLHAQDAAEARSFWSGYLADLRTPTPVPQQLGLRTAGAGAFAQASPELTSELSNALHAAARGHEVTVGALLQRAWGVLLARYARCEEVVFGVTVAGRPPQLPGVDRMIGLFINTLPIRIR